MVSMMYLNEVLSIRAQEWFDALEERGEVETSMKS